jgi:hypothetical protein
MDDYLEVYDMCCYRGRVCSPTCVCSGPRLPYSPAEADLANLCQMVVMQCATMASYEQRMRGFLYDTVAKEVRDARDVIPRHRMAGILSQYYGAGFRQEATLACFAISNKSAVHWLLREGVCPVACMARRVTVRSKGTWWAHGTLHGLATAVCVMSSPAMDLLEAYGAWPCQASHRSRLPWRRWHGRLGRRLWVRAVTTGGRTTADPATTFIDAMRGVLRRGRMFIFDGRRFQTDW